jgi:hypothetical protein
MTPIAPDVWHVPVQPLKFFGGVRMPLASTVLRLGDGKVLIYAPGRFDDEQLGAIDALGDVAYIVAPNLFHHLYVAQAVKRWPNAKLHGAPGLAAKRTDITFHHELSSTPISDTVDVEIIGGTPRLNEAVMFHRPTGTLLCADLLFNITQPANARTKLALSLTGVGGGGLKMSRLWKWTMKDAPALRASIDRVMAWPIQHVAPTHGEAADTNREHLAPLFQRAYGSIPAVR